MQRALLACSDHSYGLINELPYLLKKAGMEVTVVAYPHWSLQRSSFVDRWIWAPKSAVKVVEQLIALVKQESFDFVVLGTDNLIWALLDSEFDRSLKEKLYPVSCRAQLDLLEGKIEVIRFCRRCGIPTLPSREACSRAQLDQAAREIGFPLVVKISRSSGGSGIFKCTDLSDLERISDFTRPLLVEKYFDGQSMSVEALFLQGHLVAYNYSEMTHAVTPFAPSQARLFQPCQEIMPLLQTIGEKSEAHCFANLSFMYDSLAKKHYLIELDLRPNKWVSYGRWVGVDWVRAMRGGAAIEMPQRTVFLRHFPSDLMEVLKTKDREGLKYWFGQIKSWRTVPFYDPKACCIGAWFLIKKLFSRRFAISVVQDL